MDIEKSAASLTEALGKALLYYRENVVGQTREDFAGPLGMSEGRLRQLESGTNANSFKIEALLSAANVLNIPAPELLKKLMADAKLVDSKASKDLESAFSGAAQKFSGSTPFQKAINQEDEIFGNHFLWGLQMAELLLQLDNPAKARMEMMLRREAPKRSKEEFKKRMENLLEYDLDN